MDNEAVDVRIVIELTHDAQQFGLGDRGGFLDKGAVKPHARARFHFVSHVGAAGRIVSHQDGREVGSFQPSIQTGLDRFGQFCFDGQ